MPQRNRFVLQENCECERRWKPCISGLGDGGGPFSFAKEACNTLSTCATHHLEDALYLGKTKTRAHLLVDLLDWRPNLGPGKPSLVPF